MKEQFDLPEGIQFRKHRVQRWQQDDIAALKRYALIEEDMRILTVGDYKTCMWEVKKNPARIMDMFPKGTRMRFSNDENVYTITRYVLNSDGMINQALLHSENGRKIQKQWTSFLHAEIIDPQTQTSRVQDLFGIIREKLAAPMDTAFDALHVSNLLEETRLASVHILKQCMDLDPAPDDAVLAKLIADEMQERYGINIE